MNELIITSYNGILVTDSRDVAEKTGKRHADLLETIRKYVQYLENGKYRSQDFFIESTYKVEGNPKTYECYLLTRKGCDMVANKMTGEKGVLFTAEYVTEFEKMESEIRKPIPKLSKELQAIFMLDEKQQVLEQKVNNLENNMTIDHGQAVIIKHTVDLAVKRLCFGNESPAYRNKELKRSIYQYVWRSLKEYFQVTAYHNLLRKDMEKALKYIQELKLQGSTLRMVQIANNQISMED